MTNKDLHGDCAIIKEHGGEWVVCNKCGDATWRDHPVHVDLQVALALVRAAGYRVSKPKAKKSKPQKGPTFVATFADGEVVRLTVHCPKGLDVERSKRVAEAAWRSRAWRRLVVAVRDPEIKYFKYRQEDENEIAQRIEYRDVAGIEVPTVAPAITSYHFERDGVMQFYPDLRVNL